MIIEATDAIEQVEAHLAAVEEGEFPSLRTPGFATELRKAGIAIADLTERME